MAKRVLLAVMGAVAGAVAVTSTVSSGLPRAFLSADDSTTGATDVGDGQAMAQPQVAPPSATPQVDSTQVSTARPSAVDNGTQASQSSAPADTRPAATLTPSASESSPSAPADSGISGSFTGVAAQDGPWGSITVTVTLKNNRVVDCAMRADVYDRQSQFINTQMSDWNSGLTVPEALKRQVLKAQSAQISGVSGATYTSYAYSESLASALRQAGL